MEKYQVKFIQEAKDLLAIMESSLLQLENDPGNQSIINELFRVMHTLKGSGAMFGFDRIGSFTHDLESIYSAIRSGELMVSSHLIDVSFQSLDLIRNLLKGGESRAELEQMRDLTHKIQSLLAQKKATGESIKSQTDSQVQRTSSLSKANKSVWFINFQPHEQILTDGNDPLYMFEELASHGQILSIPLIKEIPDLSLLDGTKLYISWNMLLWSSVDEETIENVFLFVKDQSKIKIQLIHSESYGPDPSQKNQLSTLLSNERVDFSALKELLGNSTEFQGGSSAMPETNFPGSHAPSKPASGQKEHADPNETEEITIRVSSHKIDELMNLVSELITSQGQLMNLAETNKESVLYHLSEKFEKLIRQLREQTMEMSLVAVNTLSVRLKRMIRDLSSSLNKKVNFIIEGGATELDKTIIEHLSDPLLHIIRNALDHGIELPEERLRLGKPETGEIKLKAYYSGGEVHFEISDNGQGIDPERVLSKAIERNLVDPHIRLSEEEIYQFLFQPGFSTLESATTLSGRGVGMDVAQRKIAELRGEVLISSKKGSGTKVLIKLPLTLTILDGLLTRVGNTKYIIPISSVRKIYEVQLAELQTSFNSLIQLEGRQYPFLILGKEFDDLTPSLDRLQLILVEYESQRIGLIVDQIVGERQVVLKPLGPSLQKTRVFSGGSIMGDGEIALVIDANKLIKKFTSNE